MAGPTPSNLFSFSRIKTFKQCPARYRYRYLKGKQESFRSIETFLGTTVHGVLEWIYSERESGVIPALAAIQDEFNRRWNESWDGRVAIVRIDHGVDTYFDLGHEMLARFTTETLPKDASQTVALEVRFSCRLSDEAVFTGVADRVGRTTKGRLFVIDYKSSRSVGDPSELSEGLQVPLYAAQAMDRWGDTEVLAGYHYLRHGVTRWQSVTTDRAQQVMNRFSELTNQALAATEFPPHPGILCAWCGFNSICPAAEVPDALAGGLRHASQE
jgi:RecB family exonuclease